MDNEAIKTERMLRLFIEKRKVDNYLFEGNRAGSKPFTIVYSDNVCVWVQNAAKDAPIHELSITVLLNGILEQPYEAFTVKKYAELIEKSEVRRKESDNKTSIRTKYYYALHEAFLKMYPVEMKFNNQ